MGKSGKNIVLLAEGRLVNLGCAMGHQADQFVQGPVRLPGYPCGGTLQAGPLQILTYSTTSLTHLDCIIRSDSSSSLHLIKFHVLKDVLSELTNFQLSLIPNMSITQNQHLRLSSTPFGIVGLETCTINNFYTNNVIYQKKKEIMINTNQKYFLRFFSLFLLF